MKTKIAVLALLLMAGTAPAAFAQDQDHHDRGGGEQRPAGQPHEHHGGWGGGDHAARQQPAVAPQAQQAPVAPQAREPRQGFAGGGRWGQRPDAQPQARQFQPPQGPRPQQAQGRDQGGRQGYEDGRRFVRRPGSWVDTNGDDTSQGLNPADRADHEDRQDLRDWRRYGGDRRVNPQAQGSDRRGFAGGAPDRRADRRTDDGRGDDHRQGDQRWSGDRRGGDGHWNGGSRDNHGRPEWRPGAYPHSFQSHQRYHYRAYRRPPNFFFHTWGFGEFLPPAWYGPEYLIEDWWDFDLPAPPYGYDWVRVGDDAILVDGYNGRVVQVVRALFW